MADKIAVFGGTFDPVHNGHIAIAKAAVRECGLSEVVFLPNGNPPHKSGKIITDAKKRYDMVSLAVSGCDYLSVSDYEIRKTKPSYTIESLPYLKDTYGEDIYFIIGADSLYSLRSWKNFEQLIHSCGFIVADRNCGSDKKISEVSDDYIKMGADIILLSMPCIDITSTDVRRCIGMNSKFRHLVPEKVYEYIMHNKLYESYSEEKNDY